MNNDEAQPGKGGIEKLAYNTNEAAAALGVSTATLWRMEKRGMIRALSTIRGGRKLYSVRALRALVDQGAVN